MSKPVIAGIVFLVLVVAALIWNSFSLSERRVEVCMSFEGKTACRVASGATQESALRQATDNACALLTSGVTGTIACGQTKPTSVRWLD